MCYVSKNFKESELCCPCCKHYIHNVRLLYSLEKLRRLAGNLPITITSGTRCPEHNADVGGVPGSKHVSGEAADIVIHGLHPEEIAVLCQKVVAFEHGGIGLYNTFAHLDVREGGPARWHG